MRQSIIIAISAVLALVLAGCSKSDSQSGAADPAKTAAEVARSAPDNAAVQEIGDDPAVTDPDLYTNEFENERVRILRIKYGPGEEATMHSHPKSVAVFLTAADGMMTLPDGSSVKFSVPAGVASYNEAGAHQPKNTSDAAWELVEVELKPRQGEQAAPDGPDPTRVDADHYKTEFENDEVRIVRIRYGAGEESTMHYHPDSVAVFITDHLVQMTMPDGTTTEIPADAGDAMFIPGGQHLPKNVSDEDWELVLVELKR